MVYLRKILSFVIVFSLGAAGGIWAQAFLLPYLASTSPFENWQFVSDWNSRVKIITDAREVVISKDEAIEEIVQKNENVVVGIRSWQGNRAREGSGFIATSDGFIITLASIVPRGSQVMVYVRDGEEAIEAQILKRDSDQDLALLKIEKSGLQTAGFANSNDVRLGMSVLVLGKIFENGNLTTIANKGIVKADSNTSIRTNIFEKSTLGGSPLFDIEGRVLGLNVIDGEGKVTAIPSSVLREFSGF